MISKTIINKEHIKNITDDSSRKKQEYEKTQITKFWLEKIQPNIVNASNSGLYTCEIRLECSKFLMINIV